jgi:hypothetical protein
MRTALTFTLVCAVFCSIASAFDKKELIPVRPGIQHMWHYDDEGAHVCLFQYKYVKPEVEKMLEEQFPPYVFYVLAVWNENGKANFQDDGAQNTFRLCLKERKVYGNVDPYESLIKRIDDRLSALDQERYNAERMMHRVRFMDIYTENMFSDEVGQWAKSRKLTSFKALNDYVAKVDAAVQTLKNLRAVMRPINCAVGDKEWLLIGIRRESKASVPEAVYYVRPDGEVEMQRVGLTKPMIEKLELKQRPQ